MNYYNTVSVLGYTVFSDNLDKILPLKTTLINTINQYSYCVAERDPEFKQALKAADILIPDGIGVTFAYRFLSGSKLPKIAGADLHAFLLNYLNENCGSCFYLGASENTLELIGKRLRSEFPNLRFGLYSPPFKQEFSESDSAKMIAAINNFKPDVLFIGMTAPKQEKWGFTFKDSLDSRIICSIGAVFDFYAQTVHRPGERWQNLGLEWLGRLLNEPKRMWKRYIKYGFIFLGYLLKEKYIQMSRL